MIVLTHNSFLVFYSWMVAATLSAILVLSLVGVVSRLVRTNLPDIVEVLVVVIGVYSVAAILVATYELHFSGIVDQVLWSLRS